VHVIDSLRPQNLSSLFAAGDNGERIIVWDDGGAEEMEEERKAWEADTVRFLSFVFTYVQGLTWV
jgi:cell division control protein 45